MRAYPYICLEQRVSRAVALRDPKLWSGIVADLPSYLDSDGLLKYFPTMHEGSDVLTSYVLAVANEAGLSLPPDALTSMQSALANFVEGKLIRGEPFAVVDLPCASSPLSRRSPAMARPRLRSSARSSSIRTCGPTPRSSTGGASSRALPRSLSARRG